MKKQIIFSFFIFHFSFVTASDFQVSSSPDTLSFFQPATSVNKQRIHLVTYSAIGLYPVTMSWFYTQWYRDYPQSSFHFFDDSKEWLQVDKAGHLFSSYSIGKPLMKIFEWTGLEKNKSVVYGAGIAYFYQTTIEVFDGLSSEWGFSVSDVASNTLGSAILISQQLLWEEQRITLKESFHQTKYSQYRQNLLGKNLVENILKDYNGQTYWACINPKSFMNKSSRFPKWLSIAVGYGAEGMTGAFSNPELFNGEVSPVFKRYRQYYLGIDFDLSRIETKSKLLNGIFKVINIVRLPAPALEFNNGAKTKFYWLYF
jgi:VanZ family protein